MTQILQKEEKPYLLLGSYYLLPLSLCTAIQLGGLSLMEHYLLLALTGSLIYAALMHPKECYILVYGIVYLFYFPAMYMLLPLYALCNIVDQSWGTRDNVSQTVWCECESSWVPKYKSYCG